MQRNSFSLLLYLEFAFQEFQHFEFFFFLTPPKKALVFTFLQYKSIGNTVGKEEIARNEQFLLFPQCFLPI